MISSKVKSFVEDLALHEKIVGIKLEKEKNFEASLDFITSSTAFIQAFRKDVYKLFDDFQDKIVQDCIAKLGQDSITDFYQAELKERSIQRNLHRNQLIKSDSVTRQLSQEVSHLAEMDHQLRQEFSHHFEDLVKRKQVEANSAISKSLERLKEFGQQKIGLG